MSEDRWVHDSVHRIEADFRRSADTHLVPLPLPAFAAVGIDLYLKDESTHPTGSLKHRLARSLFLYALCNGWLHEGTTVVEASSGSTAVSEAYFARLLGLPFIAVMPRSTSSEKVAQISFHGGRSHFVDHAGEVYAVAQSLADETGGHYMDQFTYAERATDWRGNNNIAQSIFEQMAHERHPVPRWIVVGAGTGGTSATIGRYVHYQRMPRACAWPTPRARCSRPTTRVATPPSPRAARASRASAAREWSRASSPRWSTAWSRCPTSTRWPRCGGCRTSSGARPARQPAPTSWR
jgi:cysteine synthase A